ncbi:hypothetical protein A2V49_02775 [candidate division WWE3 bacterium RBG_19FT_COMBO_34_6]|uniref:Gcp-like domain-containing protein n=1 Tax=candidate division WWE3 bacterium RBG_19FT_COMBO_34_6 TaxID=1802612 RepID=A0A1F4UQG5_UNCKA|nr:MAG: hypothetical protein A2V49_02775 [candidate division WWE3 bacterium RBG_19FT_COMBO_34_6]
MYEIQIDSSRRKYNKISLLKDNKIIESIEGEIDIVSIIQDILNKYNLKPSEIDKVVPNLGPGSYTGLRAGVTVANIFNWVNGKITIKEQLLPEYGAEPNITPPKKFLAK